MKYIKQLNIDFNDWEIIENGKYDKYFNIFINQTNQNFVYSKINLYVNIDIFNKFKNYLKENSIKIYNITNEYLYTKQRKIKKFYIYTYNVGDNKKFDLFQFPLTSNTYIKKYKTINLIEL